MTIGQLIKLLKNYDSNTEVLLEFVDRSEDLSGIAHQDNIVGFLELDDKTLILSNDQPELC